MNVRNHRSFQFFSKRKQRHETRYEEHLASKLDRSYWIRILLEKVCCLHECRPAARACLNIFVRSSRRRNLLTLLARNFSLPDEYLPSFLPHLSPSDPNMYLQRHSVSRSREAVTIDTSCLSPSALNGNYYEYSLGRGRSSSDRRKPSLKPSIDVC